MIVIIYYDMGNISSIVNMIKRIVYDVVVSSKVEGESIQLYHIKILKIHVF